MSKSPLTISIESEILAKAQKAFPKQLGAIAEEAFKQKLNLANNPVSQEELLQELIEAKQEVERMKFRAGAERAYDETRKEAIAELGTPLLSDLPKKVIFYRTWARKLRTKLLSFKGGFQNGN